MQEPQSRYPTRLPTPFTFTSASCNTASTRHPAPNPFGSIVSQISWRSPVATMHVHPQALAPTHPASSPPAIPPANSNARVACPSLDPITNKLPPLLLAARLPLLLALTQEGLAPTEEAIHANLPRLRLKLHFPFPHSPKPVSSETADYSGQETHTEIPAKRESCAMPPGPLVDKHESSLPLHLSVANSNRHGDADRCIVCLRQRYGRRPRLQRRQH